jgi:hypothetical protein
MRKTTRRGLLAGAAFGGAAATLGVNVDRGSAGQGDAAPASGRVREYWIAAEPFRHCLAPTGRDGMTGEPIDRAKATLTALRYRAYTPGWRKPLPGRARQSGPRSATESASISATTTTTTG